MIHPTANVYESAKIGPSTKLGAFTEIGHKVSIGENCSIGCGVFIPENVIIEDNVFIGPHTVFTNDKYAPSKGEWRKEPPTVVESGVSIGANSTILPNLTIGRNAKIGAGSVVTKDVEPDTTVVGNPARRIIK
jgi:acetyltransferase-like isoleucine patch superfamily enzyme